MLALTLLTRLITSCYTLMFTTSILQKTPANNKTSERNLCSIDFSGFSVQ